MTAFLLPFANYFKSKGWNVDGAAKDIGSSKECLDTFDRVWDIQWSRNPLDLANLAKAPKTIREIIKKEEYDIVHVHTPIAAFVTRWALRKRKVGKKPKIIYTVHGFHFVKGVSIYRNLLFIFLEKLAGKWTDYLIVINQDDHEAAQKYRIIKKERLLYIPGIGVDSSYYTPDNVSKDDLTKVRNEIGLKENDKFFLMVAEFNNNKFQTEAVKALYKLKDNEIHLVFAGYGSTMPKVRKLSEDLDLSDRVHYLGFRSDIPTLMKCSQALLLTSRREGLPRCILESMSLEIPVVATNIRGTRELLADGAGIIYQVGDIEALKNAMQHIINNPEDAKKMGLKGRKQVLEKYELQKIIQIHEDLYNRILAE